jgi:methylmalonyl-CoA mutase
MSVKEQNERLFAGFPPVSTKEWEEKIHADLKGADYNKKLVWKTDEGFEVRPYYRAEDLRGLEYLDVPPGTAPFVRGVRTNANSWTIRQDIAETDVEAANRKALDAVKRGAGALGLNVTEITTHKQMSQLLKGISLTDTAIHFAHSRSFPLSLELFMYELTSRNEKSEQVKGSLNFDLIGYLLLHGDFYQSLESNLEEAVYLLNTVLKKLPHFRAITVNGHFFQDAGSTLVQELAFALASGNEYMSLMTDKGFDADAVASKIAFTFATGPNYFMEIAKLRAARLLWSRIVEQYKPKRESSMQMEIHCRTAMWNKTIYDPYVNMLRTTTEGMSAVLGNADTLVILPFDSTYNTPDDFAERIAQNQQMIMKEESYLDRIIDPAAGSYYIETLTHSIATHAWDLFRNIEEKGGMIAAVKAGIVQQMISESAQEKTAELAQRRIIQIGTNQYPNLLETMAEKISVPEGNETGSNAAYKTLKPFRVSSGFEKLRLATEHFVSKGGKRPEVFLFTFGNLAMLRARAGFITNFFGCAGYTITDNSGFTDFAEGAAAAAGSGAAVIVLCSSDEEYIQHGPGICKLILAQNPDAHIVVAGSPKEGIDLLKAAGVKDFVHVRSNLLETLEGYQKMVTE